MPVIRQPPSTAGYRPKRCLERDLVTARRRGYEPHRRGPLDCTPAAHAPSAEGDGVGGRGTGSQLALYPAALDHQPMPSDIRTPHTSTTLVRPRSVVQFGLRQVTTAVSMGEPI